MKTQLGLLMKEGFTTSGASTTSLDSSLLQRRAVLGKLKSKAGFTRSPATYKTR